MLATGFRVSQRNKAMATKPNPYDRMSDDELDVLKGHTERFEKIGMMDPDLRKFVERKWLELLRRMERS
jgi:hypothetical protein